MADLSPEVLAALAALIVAQGGAIVLLVKLFVSSKTTADQATRANQAVNNTGEGEHRLWDMVSHIRDDMSILTEAQADFTEKGWRHLPTDIGDAASLTIKIRGLEARSQQEKDDHIAIKAEIVVLQESLMEHDLWERSIKWKDVPLIKIKD